MQANLVKWVHSDDNATIFRDGPRLLAQLRARAHAQHACLPPLPAPRLASAPPLELRGSSPTGDARPGGGAALRFEVAPRGFWQVRVW